MRFIKSISLFIILTLLIYDILAERTQPVSATGSIANVDQNPSIQIQLDINTVVGFSWPAPPGPKIIVTVDDPAIPGSPDFTAEAVWEENSYYCVQLGANFTLKPGQTVTMTNGSITKEIVIVLLAITKVDQSTDTVSGLAAPFAFVSVEIGPAWAIGRSTQAGQDGLWMVDFSKPGTISSELQTFDISYGTAGQAIIYEDEDGDGMQVRWRVPAQPFLQVRPNIDQVRGWEWTAGDTVSLRINDQFIQNAKVEVASWDASQSFVEINLAGIYGIQAGDKVSLSNGLITKETVVTGLEITSVDVTDNTVSGKAGLGTNVFLWANHEGTYNVYRHVMADGNGNWKADFSTPGIEPDEKNILDIQAGTWIDSTQVDPDGDATYFGTNEWLSHMISPIHASSNPVKVNQNAAASITFYTPDMEVGDTLMWDWGDGKKTVDIHPDMPTATASHQYSQPGIYTLTATIYTSRGPVSLTERYDNLVVSGPSARVVLGDGWFDSAAGASPTSPELSGRANFLFVSAFPSFLNEPVGLIMLKVGNFNFVSTTFDWLVVSDARMQLKGRGTINGKGSYACLVNASDGQASGGADKFSIKIWNLSPFQVVYDNQPGAGDFADPSTTVGGGFILIQ